MINNISEIQNWFVVPEGLSEEVRGKREGLAEAGKQFARTVLECVDPSPKRDEVLHGLCEVLTQASEAVK